MQIFFNSAFKDEESILITPFSAGFMYGYGVFETVKIYNKHILFIDEHYQRLANSLRFLHLPLEYSLEQITGICARLIDLNALINGFVKIICSKNNLDNADIIIYSGNKYYERQYRTGFKICLANSRRNEFSKFCYIKSMNYAENIIQNNMAIENGFDEAVFLNTKNMVSEGCISNIFWVKENSIFTPSVECGILPGIARQKTIELCQKTGISIHTGEFSFDEIRNADEIFLTNSLMDIMPVCVLEDKNFDIKNYSLTNDLIQKYQANYFNFK